MTMAANGNDLQAGKKRRRSKIIPLVYLLASLLTIQSWWYQFSIIEAVGSSTSLASDMLMFQCHNSLKRLQSRGCRSRHKFSTLSAFANSKLSSRSCNTPSRSYISWARHTTYPSPYHITPINSIAFTTTSYSTSTTSLFLQPQDDNRIIPNDDETWKAYTDTLTETYNLPSISVPSKHVHNLLSSKESPIKPYLATQMVELDGVHPKIKVVRDEVIVDDDIQQRQGEESRKRILLNSNLIAKSKRIEEQDGSSSTCQQLAQQLPGIPTHIIQQLIDEYDIHPSTSEHIIIPYQNQPITRILSKILPPTSSDGQPPPSSYEQIGHVAHFNLRKEHAQHGKIIGRIILDKLSPSIQTVVNKLGEVTGPYRTYQMELLAGIEDYNVTVIEHGISLYFNLQNVYWCTRLEGERTYMIQNEFKDGQVIADAFCGVGAQLIRAAVAKDCRVVANDLNPSAVEYCLDSAKRNGIDNARFQVTCGDASQFIMNLGIDATISSEDEDDTEVPSTASNNNLPDHLLLNFPLDSPSFLNALRWWPSSVQSTTTTRVHVYTFARADDDRTAAEVAIDMVADGLLPEGGYVEPSKFRGGYLNDELGCNVKAREIRDAAPGKLVICVSFSVTRLLLRRMQGDYGLD